MDKIFQKRHSVRSFQKRKIETEKVREIWEAADSAPSAGNLKAREIILVSAEATKRKLARAAGEQNFIAQAPLILIFFALPNRSAQKYGRRGRQLYALQDATLAASFAWLQAVMLDISACWIGAFEDEKVKEILKTPADWRPIAIIAMGYKSTPKHTS